MNIQSTYHPDQNSLQLRFSADARKVFADIAQGSSWLRQQPDVIEVIGQTDASWLIEFDEGTEILAKLGSALSMPVKVILEEAQSCLRAACLTALYYDEHGLPSHYCRSAVTLLTGIVPLPVIQMALPPAVEVLDRETIPVPVWDMYETIRNWPHPGQPHGPLILLNHLGQALDQLPQRNAQIDRLTEELNRTTAFCRFTLKSLGMAKTQRLRKSGSKRRPK